jgi:F420-dependent oxidoreductase-like protein
VRIGLSGGGNTVERMVEQATQAEADGFSSLWYAGAVAGDPLIPMTLVGRATTRIELGTSVLPTYPCHPILMAGRAATTANSMGRPGLTLGLGPSHEPAIEGVYGMSYAHPGRHVEEYVTIVTRLLRGESVDLDGEEYTVRAGAAAPATGPVPVLVAALAPRLLRVAGTLAEGTITWMANARAVGELITPTISAAAGGAGRDAPRIVVGVPVAVHDDVDEARDTAATNFAVYGGLPNYRRVLAAGALDTPADAALVGVESAVTREIEALFDAGATDVWAAPFTVGDDRAASRRRTRELLAGLAVA